MIAHLELNLLSFFLRWYMIHLQRLKLIIWNLINYSKHWTFLPSEANTRVRMTTTLKVQTPTWQLAFWSLNHSLEWFQLLKQLEWGCPNGTKYPPRQPIPNRAILPNRTRIYRRTDRRTGWFQYTPPNFVAGGIMNGKGAIVPEFKNPVDLYRLVGLFWGFYITLTMF